MCNIDCFHFVIYLKRASTQTFGANNPNSTDAPEFRDLPVWGRRGANLPPTIFESSALTKDYEVNVSSLCNSAQICIMPLSTLN